MSKMEYMPVDCLQVLWNIKTRCMAVDGIGLTLVLQ